MRVSSVGFGCMGISHAYGEPMEKKDAIKLLRDAFENGYTFFDTAECYVAMIPTTRKSSGKLLRLLKIMCR